MLQETALLTLLFEEDETELALLEDPWRSACIV
jgi:hypothetical protein